VRGEFYSATAMPDPDWWEALWPRPSVVIAALGIEPDSDVVDLCCGDGLFTLPLARIARRVVAIDLNPAMLERARARLTAAGLTNCSFVTGDAYDIAKLVPIPVDAVLIANTFHGVPDKGRLARAIAAVGDCGEHGCEGVATVDQRVVFLVLARLCHSSDPLTVGHGSESRPTVWYPVPDAQHSRYKADGSVCLHRRSVPANGRRGHHDPISGQVGWLEEACSRKVLPTIRLYPPRPMMAAHCCASFCALACTASHLNTSSARATNEGGNLSPNVSAALRFTTNSIFVDTTGISAGFALPNICLA
jgi:SAM-dependent methyltransferase